MSNPNAVEQEPEKGMVVRIPTETGELTLTPMIVRKYLVNGNGVVTDQEIAMFLGLCKYQRLNPFLREAYLIKYGNQPATIVTGKEAYLKRSRQCPDFEGHKAGVIYQDQEGEIKYTEGFFPEGCKLLGGWAEVYMTNWPFPLRIEVDLKEYLGRKSDGTVNRQWTEKPATMIRKVALVQALREAFPTAFGSMYSEEEMSADNELPRSVIDMEPLDGGQPQGVGPTNGSPQAPRGPTMAQEPDGEPDKGTRIRRRSNRFDVDPALFDGRANVITCGATPDQLLQLKSIWKGQDQAKRNRLWEVLKATGYKELSYLKSEEAQQLVSEFTAGDHSGAPEVPVEVQPSGEDDSETIACDMIGKEVSVSGYCRKSCEIRAQDGFCPIIGEEPVSKGGLL